MSPDEFSAEVSGCAAGGTVLCFAAYVVRKQLIKKYGKAAERADGMIPAHLLAICGRRSGGMFIRWCAGQWRTGLRPDAAFERPQSQRAGHVHYGENFFKSWLCAAAGNFLGASLFLKPQDREVVCHASAWDVDSKDDLR